MLNQEPIIRIGLATNAQNVSISTADSTLVAMSAGEPSKFLEANKITVAARSYRPPEYEIYHFEIPNILSQIEADTARQRNPRSDE